MRLLARHDLWERRDCEWCEQAPSLREEWGCEAETGEPIEIERGPGQPSILVTRCPRALLRESPGEARWGLWANRTSAYAESGNLGAVLHGARLSAAGEEALAIYSQAVAARYRSRENKARERGWRERRAT